MADLSEGFIGLPGGYGTLEEVRLSRRPRSDPSPVRPAGTDSSLPVAQVAEMTTWSQIGVHLKRASSLSPSFLQLASAH